ncbi:MAG: hypothetical protein ACR2QE_21260 [Acidimicrobiales bacterium]
MRALTIELAGQTVVVEAGDEMTFGRDADLVVDENPYLHRHLGVFRHRNGVWWLVNVGSSIALEVGDISSPSKMTVSPGTSTPLPYQESVVRFTAGPTVYELVVTRSVADEVDLVDDAPTGAPTITTASIPLNLEQRQLLVALAENRLRDAGVGRSEIPTNRQVADRLGWTVTKFNRKLDYLCVKFDQLGVSGLKGDIAGLASSRRERLVDHAVTVGIIDNSDLELLDRPETHD